MRRSGDAECYRHAMLRCNTQKQRQISKMLKIAHITASPFFGGPERQMLELARTFRRENREIEVLFVSFSENGNGKAFLDEAEKAGFETFVPKSDMPHLWAASKELYRFLVDKQVDIVLLHGHKARMLGWFAAKKAKIPMIGVSRGWTTENWKIGVYNMIDKWMHRRMDHVVCVSQGQAEKVSRSGTPKDRITVIRNSIRTERFNSEPDPAYRQNLESMFKNPPKFILGDAGRLSPEKGFDILIDSVSKIVKKGISVGLVIFGEGFLREQLQKQIDDLSLSDSVSLAGFTNELDKFMPHFDVFVQSSHTEGLPNVLLEAMAARTAVVATEVGGTNEVVVEGETGFMVPPNNANELADAIQKVLQDDSLRESMGTKGHKRVDERFTFESQSAAYWELFQKLQAKSTSIVKPF